jgi:DNA-binding transcriptional regulator YiaG
MKMGLASVVKYASVAAMERKIEKYFAERAAFATEVYSSKKGEVVEVREQAPLHLTGLCDYLGISKQTLDEYQQKPEFAELIRKAKKKCEAYLVDQCVRLHKADFVLKNDFPSAWQESSETNLNEELKKVLVEFVARE